MPHPWPYVSFLVVSSFLPWTLLAAEGPFFLPQRILGLPRTVVLASGDFDGDGAIDLAAAGGGAEVVLLFQEPAEPRSWRKPVPVSVGSACFHLRAGDANRDGIDDLLVCDPGTQAYLLLSRGGGLFTPPAALPSSRGARWSAVGDWNSDGALDAAIATHSLGTIAVYLGSGDGHLELKADLATGGRPHSIESLDWEADGKLDLAVGIDSSGILPLEGDGAGNFSFRPRVEVLGHCFQTIATGDFNRDGRPDVATECGVGMSRAAGGFEKVALAGDSWVQSAIADMDGDGKADLLRLMHERLALQVLPGDGQGGFRPPVEFAPAGETALWVIARDLDGDGRNDAAIADHTASSITVFWGRPGERFLGGGEVLGRTFPGTVDFATADVDRDGHWDLLAAGLAAPWVDFYRGPFTVPAAGPAPSIDTGSPFTSIEAADLDGDGTPDLAGLSAGLNTLFVVFLRPEATVRFGAEIPTGPLPTALALGDLTADGIADAAVANAGSSEIAIFEGKRGSEPLLVRSLAIGAVPRAVSIADFDGDGRPDILAGVAGTPPGFAFFKNRGGMNWAPTRRLAAESPLGRMRAADIDGDGRADLTFAGVPRRSIALLLQRGDLDFAPHEEIDIGFTPFDHFFADWGGDGTADWILLGDPGILVLSGRTPAQEVARLRRGDADGDGERSVSDAVVVLLHLFLGGGPLACPDAADTDDSGALDLADPIGLLNHLFLGAGPVPEPSGPHCGPDPSADGLGECADRC